MNEIEKITAIKVKISQVWQVLSLDHLSLNKLNSLNCNPFQSSQCCTLSPNYCFCFAPCTIFSQVLLFGRDISALMLLLIWTWLPLTVTLVVLTYFT